MCKRSESYMVINAYNISKARYTPATKLNSIRSTLWKVDRVDCVALVPYTLGTKSTVSATKLNIYGNSRLFCRFVAGFSNSRLSTKSTVLNSGLTSRWSLGHLLLGYDTKLDLVLELLEVMMTLTFVFWPQKFKITINLGRVFNSFTTFVDRTIRFWCLMLITWDLDNYYIGHDSVVWAWWVVAVSFILQ